MKKFLTILLLTIITSISYSQTLSDSTYVIKVDGVFVDLDYMKYRHLDTLKSTDSLKKEILDMELEIIKLKDYNKGFKSGYELKYYFFAPHFRKKYYFNFDY